jgi:hypothetical protein
MAIRPTDLQLTIVQSINTAAAVQRSDEAPHAAQLAAQAAFVAQTETRSETVAQAGALAGNRVEVGEHAPREGGDRPARRRTHAQPPTPFEAAVDEAAGFDDAPHLIDVRA